MCGCITACLRNHPHDARGVLSYLRGGVGAYGYLVHAFAEGDLLQQIAGNDRRWLAAPALRRARRMRCPSAA